MSVTWLHVSDFHFRAGDGYDRDVVLRALVESVRRYREHGRTVDLVFATGDISQSGQPAEYAHATQFFDALLEALTLPRERLFVVPGNHDVDRRLGVGLARTLQTLDECNTYFDPGIPKPHATQKMRAFGKWFGDYFKGLRVFPDASSCGSVETLVIRGHQLAVLPINSALFCQDDNDHAKLLLGRRCLDPALSKLHEAGDALKIVLLHHPLDWLSDIERANIRASLHRHVDVVLRGHLHETDVENVVATTGSTLHIAAGAAYQTRAWPNRAYYATLTDDRQLRLFPIRYEDSPTEVWTTDPSVFPHDPGHERSFPVRALTGGSPGPVSPSPVPASIGSRPSSSGFLSNVASRGNAPFVGRDGLLLQMRAILAEVSTERVLVLHGPPGVGKSELAREYARCNAARYPGGRFIVQGGSELLDLARIGTNMLGLPYAPGLSLDDQCERTLLHLHGQASLLIFDNPASRESIVGWLPRSGMTLHAVVTTTNERWCDEWPSLEVPTLPDDVAGALVAKLGGAEVARQVGDGLVALSGGLPMQLVPAARALAYEQRRGRLNRAAIKLAREAADSFDLAVLTLPSAARLVLHAAAFFTLQRIPVDEVFHHVEPLIERGHAEFDRLLDQCIDLHLLEGQAELRMHQLLAAYLAGRSGEDVLDDQLEVLKRRRADRIAALSRKVGRSPADASVVGPFLTYPFGSDAWASTRLESNSLEQHQLGYALSMIGRYEEARPWYERAVAEREKGDAYGRVDHESLGGSVHQVGICLSSLGRYEEAQPWYERAVSEKEKGDVHGRVDHESLGRSVHQVGICLSSLDRYEEARPWYERAVAEAEKGDVRSRVDHESLGSSVHQVGICLSSLGRYEEARPWYERAVAEAEKGDVHGSVDHGSLGSSVHTVGICLSSLGRYEEAQPWYERAVLEKEKGDVHGRVDHESLSKSVHAVGICLSSLGRYEEARPWYERAVAEAEKGDVHSRIDHESLGSSVHQVGICLSSLGRYEEARPWYERAVAEAEKGDVHGRVDHGTLGSTVHTVGICLSSLGRYEEAQPWYERAVVEKEKAAVHGRVDHESLSKSVHAVGICLSSLGRYEEARPWYERAVAEAEKGNLHGRVDHESLGSSLQHVGVCLSSLGRYEEARPWYERAVVEKEKGDVHGCVDYDSLRNTLRCLVEVCDKSSHHEDSTRWRAKLRELRRRADSSATATLALGKKCRGPL